MATYSFMDVTASLSGPTGEIDLGYGSASSEEGITVAMGGPKNTMTIGADGEVMQPAEDLADKQKAVAGVQRAESVLRYLGKQRHCDPQQGERRHHHGAQRGVPETAG